MYRYLMKKSKMVQVATSSVVKQLGCGSAISRQYSALQGRHGMTVLRPGMTYCQWRYLKRTVMPCGTLTKGFSNQSQSASQIVKLQERDSMKDVFERYHVLLCDGSFGPASIISFTSALCSSVYADLSWLPWLHRDNHIISYMQILMNGKTEELLAKPLYSQDHFEDIYNHIDQNFMEIPDGDCPSVLASLIYSGLDLRDPLVVKLLHRCYDAVPNLSVAQVRDSTHVLQSLGNRDFVFAGKLVSRLNELLGEKPQHVQFAIQDLCLANPVLAAYMSKEMVEKCVAAMLFKVQEKYPDLDIPTIGSCLRYVRKMGYRADRENLNKIKTLARASMDNIRDFNLLQSQHVAEIGHNAKRLGCYTGDIVDRLQARSLQLLRDPDSNLTVADVTNLLFAFSRDSSPAILKELSQVLMKYLPDADVLILSNIADNMLELGFSDPDLMALFQAKILENITNISMYITRLVKVLRFLRDRLDFDQEFNHHINEVLLRLLDRRQGYDPTFVIVVAQFVLPSIRTIVPAILMDCLLNVIPRCSLPLMLLILNGLDRMKGPWSRSLHAQVLELRSKLQETISEQVENAVYATQLAQMIQGLHIKSTRRDFVLLDRMMEHYPRLTKTMSRHDYIRTVQVFKRLSHPYYHPQVFEDLIAFSMNNYPQLTLPGVLDLAIVLGAAGYRPENFDSFSEFAVQALEDAMQKKDHIGLVSLAHYLTLMHIFPDTVLAHIFTFDFLEELDSVIEADPERQGNVKKLMMQLNRSLILECPHLDVPWFHEQYCRKLTQASYPKDFQRNLSFVDEVEAALQEVMRGLKFVGQNVYSPYFHPIDFEIILDPAGEPVEATVAKQIPPDTPGYQRLAVMLIGNQQLCANSHRRRGHYLRDRRHLEIQGYRVEEISRYDWNSMALSDWGSKVDYVRSKVFQTSGKQPPASLSKSKTMHPYWK